MTPFNYINLRRYWRKGLRNGNLRKLNRSEKGFYRAAMRYAKARGKIVNSRVGGMLSGIIEKLKETIGTRIFKKGLERSLQLLRKCEENDVFAWAPRLRDWLKDPDYIFWLGMAR